MAILEDAICDREEAMADDSQGKMKPPPLLSMVDGEAMVVDLSLSSASSFGHGCKASSEHPSFGDPISQHSPKLHRPISLQRVDFSSDFGGSSNIDLQEEKVLSIGATESDYVEIPCPTPEYDVTSFFETNSIFASKEELIDWVRNIGRSLSYVVTILGSDKVTGRPRPRVLLGCDRAGYNRDNPKQVRKNMRKTTSKKCGCPFQVRGQKDICVDEWRVEVLCGKHNHGFVHLEAHSFAGRLDKNEETFVGSMYASGVKPRKILSSLKKKNPANTTTIRTIYNHRAAVHKNELGGRTPIQFLYKCVTNAGYVCYSRVKEDCSRGLHWKFNNRMEKI